jgi:hypothetical protein
VQWRGGDGVGFPRESAEFHKVLCSVALARDFDCCDNLRVRDEISRSVVAYQIVRVANQLTDERNWTRGHGTPCP